MRRTLSTMLPSALIVSVGAYYLGGWAVLTVDEVPDYVTAKTPVTIAYVARQHGAEPLGKLDGVVEARSGSTVVSARAKEARTGHYSASLTLPHSGSWTVSITSGFGPSNAKLMPIRAIDFGGTPPALTDMERGRRLYVAKGCITCHVHAAVSPGEMIQVKAAPELTQKRYAADYLALYLANPSIRPPSTPGGAQMPNLGLKPAEIAALSAFINGASVVGSAK